MRQFWTTRIQNAQFLFLDLQWWEGLEDRVAYLLKLPNSSGCLPLFPIRHSSQRGCNQQMQRYLGVFSLSVSVSPHFPLKRKPIKLGFRAHTKRFFVPLYLHQPDDICKEPVSKSGHIHRFQVTDFRGQALEFSPKIINLRLIFMYHYSDRSLNIYYVLNIVLNILLLFTNLKIKGQRDQVVCSQSYN